MICGGDACFAVFSHYLRPKSAGISPHSSVFHFSTLTPSATPEAPIGSTVRHVFSIPILTLALFFNHSSARWVSWRACAVFGVGFSVVFALPVRNHVRAVLLSVNMGRFKLRFLIRASACTRARNSPMLFVPCTGPKWKMRLPEGMCTHWYSIFPGLPEHAASVHQASVSNGGAFFFTSFRAPQCQGCP